MTRINYIFKQLKRYLLKGKKAIWYKTIFCSDLCDTLGGGTWMDYECGSLGFGLGGGGVACDEVCGLDLSFEQRMTL